MAEKTTEKRQENRLNRETMPRNWETQTQHPGRTN